MIKKVGKSILRSVWWALRFFWRHPATAMVILLALVALALGYRAWRSGFPAAIFTLIRLAPLLVLIIIVFLARGKIGQWMRTRASQGKTMAQRRIAKGVVQEGIDRGEAVLERGAETAKEALATLAEEVKADWERSVAKPRPARLQAPRCPFCGHLLRSGAKFCDHCGRPLRLTCPQCGNVLRPGAKFCEYCGAPVVIGKPS